MRGVCFFSAGKMCIRDRSSTATIDQIGKSDQAISAMVNSVVAFINAFRSYGPQDVYKRQALKEQLENKKK